MLNFFRPKPGSFGVQRAYRTFVCGADPITASNTTLFKLGGFANRRVKFVKFACTSSTVAVSSGKTILVKAQKYDASATSAVDLTGTTDITTHTADIECTAKPCTASDANAIFDTGDTLYIQAVSNGAIGTQPVGLTFVAEFIVLD